MPRTSPTDPSALGPLDDERPQRPVRRPDDVDAAGLGRARASAFVAPALVLIGVFLVFPALWTLYLGVTNWRLTGLAAAEPEFVGLDNYVDALSDDRFLGSLYRTFVFVIGSAIAGQMVLGFIIAWLMRNTTKLIRGLVETLVLIAWILPASVIAWLWLVLLDRRSGTLNAILGTEDTAWLLEYPMQSIIAFNIFNGTAFSMLLFSSALASIPPSQIETAKMSGARTWATLRDVVFPNIRGHILTVLLLVTLWTFNVFAPFLLTGGGPGQETEIFPVLIYRLALQTGELGKGAAFSLIMIIINLAIALIYLRVLRERRQS
ncbi:carbohydrate ABC transporter permease [Phytoactinopolyspora halotolerans]|uniref:carbohydrate ABC transporter permease n=1 Tax=Phytoactinopolyspora halotolerans TaxID=1981512 RepID=UPI001C2092F8|nr:sugar ABC transporter permease [Phytoactinopolyspora halotolerans]